jgi:hypothetical protein
LSKSFCLSTQKAKIISIFLGRNKSEKGEGFLLLKTKFLQNAPEEGDPLNHPRRVAAAKRQSFPKKKGLMVS